MDSINCEQLKLTARHNGCNCRRNRCKTCRRSGCSHFELRAFSVTADAISPLQRMHDQRYSGCTDLSEKFKSAFNHGVLVKQRLHANPSLILSNQLGGAGPAVSDSHVKWTRLKTQTGAYGIDVNRCKNIEIFTFHCNAIQNFRFHCIAKINTSRRSSGIRNAESRSFVSDLFRSSPSASRGVKGPPLPTQFGGAKLYRG